MEAAEDIPMDKVKFLTAAPAGMKVRKITPDGISYVEDVVAIALVEGDDDEAVPVCIINRREYLDFLRDGNFDHEDGASEVIIITPSEDDVRNGEDG